ncbi:MAG: hypothetical protein R6V43_05720, partial [Halopseudomonas sp.]
MNTYLRFAILAASLSVPLPASAGDAVGVVNFQANCAEHLRPDVDHALGMMHHMMYTQALAEFDSISQKAPGCAAAHWGLATSLLQPLWGTTPSPAEIARGREAIGKAREAAEDEREKLLIEATAAFFEPETEQVRERLSGWIVGMEKAYQAFPEDLNVATLYALSRLTLALSADDPQALHDEAEHVLRTAWETEPNHPGAVHYSIHATDADGRAEHATEIVDSYAEIAPDVPHALHMPSHIYVRLGDWPRTIEWNRRSADVARNNKEGDALSFHYIHAVDYQV